MKPRSIIPNTSGNTNVTTDDRLRRFYATITDGGKRPLKSSGGTGDFAGDLESQRHEDGRPGNKGNKPHRGRPETEIRV